MSTRGKIWNPGAATFQRVFFPGYGSSQPEISHPTPEQPHSLLQVDAVDEPETYQVNRKKVDRIKTPEGDRYVLSSQALRYEESVSSVERAGEKLPLFAMANETVGAMNQSTGFNEVTTQPPTRAPIPSQTQTRGQRLVEDLPESGGVMNEKSLHELMQKEIAELRDQLKATLIKSVNDLVTESGSSAKSNDQDAQLKSEPIPESPFRERLKVGTIESYAVEPYQQKTLHSNNILSFYEKKPLPSVADTPYQLPVGSHKTIATKLSTTLPGVEIRSCKLPVLPVKQEDKATSVCAVPEEARELTGDDWAQVAQRLEPLIQETCRSLIEQEVRILREELAIALQDRVELWQKEEQLLNKNENSTDAASHELKKELSTNPPPEHVADSDEVNSPVDHSVTIKKASESVNRVGGFSEAGAIAYRKLRQNKKRKARLNQPVRVPLEDTLPVTATMTEGQKHFQGLRSQLNALVASESQFFSATQPPNLSSAVDLKVSCADRKHMTAIAKYTATSAQSVEAINSS